jgi:2-iminoacetate synthase
MKFNPQKYRIPDEPMKPFIDAGEINEILENTISSKEKVREVIANALNKNRLSMQEVAVLINTTDPSLVEEIKSSATKLRESVYGKRIVLFAPLYVGNQCINDCKYCGFKTSNKLAKRKTLTREELIANVKALEDEGQKRLILVFGESSKYKPGYIADCVKTVYNVKNRNGEIRRVNINAAPLDIEGFKIVKDSGIGTYQVFQETYNIEAYSEYHRTGPKSDFENRLTSLDRAQEAGLDDVGIGALFGLYDWKFEVLGLVRHTNHLEACYNVGPHTISFPRLQNASSYDISDKYKVSDEDFEKLIAIIRLAVPYTGMILTAREPEEVRNNVLRYGCSQIDAGTKIVIGAYSEKNSDQDLNREQFLINDSRSLNEVMDELIRNDYIPSFCTACYRLGRTGEHFMEFSVPGFIKRFCTPNAILTLAEYLVDYAPADSIEKGWNLIEKNIDEIKDLQNKEELEKRVLQIKAGKRDLYF